MGVKSNFYWRCARVIQNGSEIHLEPLNRRHDPTARHFLSAAGTRHKNQTTMELIIWRHAEAEEGSPDMTRKLTTRGRRQATRMAKWLNLRLPEDALILVSPSRRTLETAEALARPFQVHPDLAPDATAEAVLHTIGWPDAPHPVLIVRRPSAVRRTDHHEIAVRKKRGIFPQKRRCCLDAAAPPRRSGPDAPAGRALA